jgi:hypothetical protein
MELLIIMGVCGGVALDLLNLVELGGMPKSRRPDLKDILYWIAYLVWPPLGGFLVYLYLSSFSDLHINNLLAFQLGLSGPITLKALANSVPNQIEPAAGA